METAKASLKKIQNPSRRQIRFCRRRSGMVKKCRELALLCDAEIALIIFSETGQLDQYSSADMQSSLWRYESSHGEDKHDKLSATATATSAADQHVASQYYEVEKEMHSKKINHLEKTQRNLMGEDLDSMTLEELNCLEKMVERTVRRISKEKLKLMLEEVKALQEQVRCLQDENKALQNTLH